MNINKDTNNTSTCTCARFKVISVLAFLFLAFLFVSSKKISPPDQIFGGTFLFPNQGGTGTSTKPTLGQLLMGNSSGTYSVSNPIFTSLTSTNAVFTNATSTNLYVSSIGNIVQLGVNTSSPVAQLAVTGVSTRDPVKVVSSTNAQLFAVKTNGQVVVGANSLSQTGQLTIETPTTNDVALSFTNGVHYTFQLGRVAGTSGQSFIGGPFGTALNLRAGGVDRVFIRNDTGYVGINSTTPSTQLVVVGTSTLEGLTIFTTANGTSITSTNANFTNLSFTNATGTSITSTNLYVSAKASIGTTTNTYGLNVGNYLMADRIYTPYSSMYITNDTAGMLATGGNFSVQGGYIYGVGSGVSIYSQNNLSVRGSLLKDNGAFLSVTGGTSGITYLTSKVGINTTTPTTELQVTALASNTTSTLTVGKSGQTKGSCLELYDSGGTAVYAYVASGATAFTLSNTSCK